MLCWLPPPAKMKVRVRRAALESLGYSSRPEVTTLIESAFHREDPAWQASALIAMGRSADERWDEEVTRSLVHVNDSIRKAAVQAAGELSLQSARPILLKMLGEEEDGQRPECDHLVSFPDRRRRRADVSRKSARSVEEDDEQIAFLEEALDNLLYRRLDRFDLLAFDPR